MTQDSATNQMSALAGVALRYPEKTFYLGQVFKDTTNSYKLFWFLAILSLLKRSEERSFRLADIFTEMAVAAWHPVCLFRLSLGRQDKLQDVIGEIQKKSSLPPNAAPEAIRKFVDGSADAQRRERVRCQVSRRHRATSPNRDEPRLPVRLEAAELTTC